MTNNECCYWVNIAKNEGVDLEQWFVQSLTDDQYMLVMHLLSKYPWKKFMAYWTRRIYHDQQRYFELSMDTTTWD